MITTRVPPSDCPTCGARTDAATEAPAMRARPQPGDYSICFACGAICRFDATLRLVALDADERVPSYIVALAERLRRSRQVH